MENSANYADLLEKGMRKKKAKMKSWQSTDKRVDPGFLRDMGYGNKKKKKGK